jgi:hypothetical protein
LIAFYAAAGALGVLAGLAFAWIWLRIVPHRIHGAYWREMAALTREMLHVEETRAFVRLYGRLGRLLGPYVARNLGGMAAACLPLILVSLTVAPMLFDAWDARAERRRLVYPNAEIPLSLPPPESARVGYCSAPRWCLVFAALDFEVVELREAGVPWAVSRGDHGAVNPLWPFLGDLEAAFLAAFVLTMFAAFLWPRPSLHPATTRSSS